MRKYQFYEINFLTQEEMGTTAFSFTARTYAERLYEIRRRINDLDEAIFEHGDEDSKLLAKKQGLVEALTLITGIQQMY